MPTTCPLWGGPDFSFSLAATHNGILKEAPLHSSPERWGTNCMLLVCPLLTGTQSTLPWLSELICSNYWLYQIKTYPKYLSGDTVDGMGDGAGSLGNLNIYSQRCSSFLELEPQQQGCEHAQDSWHVPSSLQTGDLQFGRQRDLSGYSTVGMCGAYNEEHAGLTMDVFVIIIPIAICSNKESPKMQATRLVHADKWEAGLL